jgi:hypothetical protein
MNELVDKLILQKQQGKDNKKKIDEFVYTLYNLSADGINIMLGK